MGMLVPDEVSPIAEYYRVREGTVDRTVTVRAGLQGDLMVDVDAGGRVIGVEKIGAPLFAADWVAVIRWVEKV